MPSMVASSLAVDFISSPSIEDFLGSVWSVLPDRLLLYRLTGLPRITGDRRIHNSHRSVTQPSFDLSISFFGVRQILNQQLVIRLLLIFVHNACLFSTISSSKKLN